MQTPLDFLNVEKQKEVIKNGIKQAIITKIQNKHPYFLLNLIFFYIFASKRYKVMTVWQASKVIKWKWHKK